VSFAYDGGQRSQGGGGSSGGGGPPRDWTPAERAEHARNVAGNLRRSHAEVKRACAAMADATTPVAYGTAATQATEAVASLRAIASHAPPLVDASADPDISGVLASAAQSLAAAETLLAAAPAAPAAPAAQMSSSAGIAAVVATLPPLGSERRQEAPAVAAPIFASLRGQLEFPDINPLRAAFAADGEVGQRFRLLSQNIRDQVERLLTDNQFVQSRRFEHEDRINAGSRRGVSAGRKPRSTVAEPVRTFGAYLCPWSTPTS
jgi:hypothetical protein